MCALRGLVKRDMGILYVKNGSNPFISVIISMQHVMANILESVCIIDACLESRLSDRPSILCHWQH
jgi:hypothetical protein